jgi:amino acid transporter
MDQFILKLRGIYRPAISEFLWMWLASVCPIIFGSLFIKMKYSDVDYLYILCDGIEVDTVFAYIATMIAPFLYLLARLIAKKKEAKGRINNIKHGGILIALSIVITVVISGLFYQYKIDVYENKKNTVNEQGIASRDVVAMPYENKNIVQSQQKTEEKVKSASNKSVLNLSFKGNILLLCYLMSLLIWYYTIYLKYFEAPDLLNDEKKRVKSHMDAISAATEGQ